MPDIIPAAESLAYLYPRDDVVTTLDPSNHAVYHRALMVNERTLIVPHEENPEDFYNRELDLVVGPVKSRDPFARVKVRTVGVVEFWSNVYIAWVRFAPAVPVEAPLPEQPWDDSGPLVQALQRLPEAMRGDRGTAGFWAEAVNLGLTEVPEVGEHDRIDWNGRARSGLELTERPKLVTVSASGDYKWRLWPPELW